MRCALCTLAEARGKGRTSTKAVAARPSAQWLSRILKKLASQVLNPEETVGRSLDKRLACHRRPHERHGDVIIREFLSMYPHAFDRFTSYFPTTSAGMHGSTRSQPATKLVLVARFEVMSSLGLTRDPLDRNDILIDHRFMDSLLRAATRTPRVGIGNFSKGVRAGARARMPRLPASVQAEEVEGDWQSRLTPRNVLRVNKMEKLDWRTAIASIGDVTSQRRLSRCPMTRRGPGQRLEDDGRQLRENDSQDLWLHRWGLCVRTKRESAWLQQGVLFDGRLRRIIGQAIKNPQSETRNVRSAISLLTSSVQ